MNAGIYREWISIEQRQPGTDDAGQPSTTWQPYVSVWACIKGQTGMGSIRQSTPQDNVAASMNSYSFRIRFREDITDAMRVVFAGQAFDIKQVRMDWDHREWTDLVCEQGGNDG